MDKIPLFLASLALLWFGIAAIRGKGWSGQGCDPNDGRPFKPNPVMTFVGLVLVGLGIVMVCLMLMGCGVNTRTIQVPIRGDLADDLKVEIGNEAVSVVEDDAFKRELRDQFGLHQKQLKVIYGVQNV